MNELTAQPTNERDSKSVENGINYPKIGADGAPTQRAITSAKQAWTIAKNQRKLAMEGRIATAGLIADKYNGGTPYAQQDLDKNGQGWRNNFSTGFLGSIVDRVKPQLLDPIKNAQTLTHSTLPSSVPNAAEKSRVFQSKISKIIRSWSSWDDFTSRIAQENVLNGCCAPVRTSKNWRPALYTFGEQYFPAETGQHSTSVPFMVLEERILLCNFIKLFKDKEIAIAAGYNYENCVKAANTSDGKREDLHALQEQDLIREQAKIENTYGDSDTKAVMLYHVLVQDHTGEIDIWTVTQNDGAEIRSEKNIFDSIEDTTTLITFQSGNSKYYGSKGLGRLLANLHIAIDRLRNLGADQSYLAGLVIVVGEAANINPQVLHPFIVIPSSDAQISKEKIEFNADAHQSIVNDLISIAESIAGSFIPPNLEGSSSAPTRIEAAQQAEREIAVKQGVLGRFSKQFSMMISMMQRGICSPLHLMEAQKSFESKAKRKSIGEILIDKKTHDLLKKAFGEGLKDEVGIETEETIGDPEAINCIIEMLEEGLTIGEIARLSVTPADSDEDTEGSDSTQRTLAFIANSKMSPYINQRAAAEMEAKLAIGEEKADQLLAKQEDPNEEAIATRQQIMEFSEMLDGNQMPVAQTDNHQIHLKTLFGKGTAIMVTVSKVPTPPLVEAAKLIMQHAADHIGADMMMPEDQKGQIMEQLKPWEAAIAYGEQMLAQQEQQGIQPGSIPPDGGQQPQGGQEGQGGQQGSPMDPAQYEIEQARLAQGDRKLALEEAKHQHERDMGAVKASTDTTRAVLEIAKASKEEGSKDAAKDLAETPK